MLRRDAYCADNGITYIDFLKVDVEGLELEALQGFGDMLHGGAIRAIQLEFSDASAAARTQLADFHDLLSEFTIGRI
jgi:hypothetical protein